MKSHNEAPCSKPLLRCFAASKKRRRVQGILKAKLLRSRIPTLLRPSVSNRWWGSPSLFELRRNPCEALAKQDFAGVLLPPSSPQQASSSLLRSSEEAQKSAGYSAKKNKVGRALLFLTLLSMPVCLGAQEAFQEDMQGGHDSMHSIVILDEPTEPVVQQSDQQEQDQGQRTQQQEQQEKNRAKGMEIQGLTGDSLVAPSTRGSIADVQDRSRISPYKPEGITTESSARSSMHPNDNNLSSDTRQNDVQKAIEEPPVSVAAGNNLSTTGVTNGRDVLTAPFEKEKFSPPPTQTSPLAMDDVSLKKPVSSFGGPDTAAYPGKKSAGIPLYRSSLARAIKEISGNEDDSGEDKSFYAKPAAQAGAGIIAVIILMLGVLFKFRRLIVITKK